MRKKAQIKVYAPSVDKSAVKLKFQSAHPNKINFERIFNLAPALFLVVDRNFEIIAVNDAYLRATMTERNKIIGKRLFDAISEKSVGSNLESIKQFQSSMKTVMETKSPDTMSILKYVHCNPETKILEERYWSPINTPVLDENGEIEYVIHRVEDVTEFINLKKRENSLETTVNSDLMAAEIIRRNYEIKTMNENLRLANALTNKKLQFTEERYQTLAENLPLLVWTANPDGALDYYNRRWYEYTGQNPDNAVGWGWQDVHHPDDLPKVLEEWPKALALGEPYQAEFRLKSAKNGEYRWFLTRAIPIRDEAGQIVKWFGTNTDIHELRSARESLEHIQSELVQSKQIAESANAAKSAFVANVSHEIRTPLAAIIGYSEFLLEPDKSASEKHNCAVAIRRNSEHLANLINEVLDLSKIEAGFLEIEPVTFNLGEVLEYIEAVSGYKARDKGLSFEFKISPSVPRNVRTDPTRLRQILTNVIGNAVKFTERGSVFVSVDCDAPLDSSKSRILRIGVRDSGVGICSTRKNDIFKRFMQSDASTSRKFGGTGLGLQLSRKLANALGGDVDLIESELGNGSYFQITLEIGSMDEVSQSVFEDSVAERAKEILAVKKESFKDVHILVVDDSEDNRDILKIMLKPTGAEIETAVNGEKGVEKALSSDVDVVLMDIQMPGIDGHEATKLLRARGFRKPIIALTAHALKEDRERSIQSGFDDHLTKPVKKAELLSAIAHYAGKIKKMSRNTPSVSR